MIEGRMWRHCLNEQTTWWVNHFVRRCSKCNLLPLIWLLENRRQRELDGKLSMASKITNYPIISIKRGLQHWPTHLLRYSIFNIRFLFSLFWLSPSFPKVITNMSHRLVIPLGNDCESSFCKGGSIYLH